MNNRGDLTVELVMPTPTQRELWRQNLARLCTYWESLGDSEATTAYSRIGADNSQLSKSLVDNDNSRNIEE